MNLNSQNQSQFELFPAVGESTPEIRQRRLQLKDLTVTPENIIVLSIVFTMVLVLMFSFGVEKGRALAAANLNLQEAKVEDLTKEAPAEPSQAAGIPQTKTSAGSLGSEIADEKREILKIPEIEYKGLDYSYTIQVASFKTQKSAKREVEVLQKRGYDASIVSKGGYSIVCVGKFLHKDEAKKFATRLKSQYTDYLVRRL